MKDSPGRPRGNRNRAARGRGPEQRAENEARSLQEMDREEFEALLAAQPLAVIETNYVAPGGEYSALYPDLLQAVLQNNTQEEIRDVVVAFAAWDEDQLPVKMEGQSDPGGGAYKSAPPPVFCRPPFSPGGKPRFSPLFLDTRRPAILKQNKSSRNGGLDGACSKWAGLARAEYTGVTA